MPRASELRIGFVGAGFLSQAAHLPSFAAVPGARLVALADRRPELCARVAARWGIERTHSDHRSLLDDPQVDAVVCITPRFITAEVASDVLAAGKPLFTEKPMAGSVEQARRLLEQARAGRLPYAVGTMRRFDPGYQYARDWIRTAVATGALGALTYARVSCFQGDDYCNEFGVIDTGEPRPSLVGHWRAAPDDVPDAQVDEFARFHNVFIHDVDLLRFLVGDPTGVDYVRGDPASGRIVVFDHGSHGSVLEAGEVASSRWEEAVTVCFERGRIEIRSPEILLRNQPARVEVFRSDRGTEVPHVEFGWAFHRQARAWVDAVLHGHELVNDAAESVADLELIEAIWRKERHQWQSHPLSTTL